ncbi:hypothetical protein GCM10010095_21480 [Streptomyces anthocyanicus]|nr:hypothetical protein GCM10010095_21480 [Streptomyces anthocyanicus]
MDARRSYSKWGRQSSASRQGPSDPAPSNTFGGYSDLPPHRGTASCRFEPRADDTQGMPSAQVIFTEGKKESEITPTKSLPQAVLDQYKIEIGPTEPRRS